MFEVLCIRWCSVWHTPHFSEPTNSASLRKPEASQELSSRSKPESLGVIANTKKSILKPVASSRRDETGGAAAETACEYSPAGYGKRYTAGKSKWTQGYYRWLAEVKISGSAPSSRKARQG